MDLTRSCLASTCGREAPMPGVVKDRPDFWIDAACAWKTQMMLTISPQTNARSIGFFGISRVLLAKCSTHLSRARRRR